MPSIIQGYNYDIFISYRQKDNKHDGWVTEFVENLKGELESTFKEEISVYFDINPHDGLLETHDVDESLKEKLKCLIFIPVISRTYCDPKAFAWEHEFKAFVEQVSQDEFGLKVRLSNGNVASRVLPVIIYDLDKQDIRLFESVVGGVLRGVEFIYKEPGVNRPLRSNEERPHENLNNTVYRNQVNKVANTIRDVLISLTEEGLSVEEATHEPTSVDEKIHSGKPSKKKQREIPAVSLLNRVKNLARINLNTWRTIALVLIAVSVGLLWLCLSKKPPAPYRAELRYDIPLAYTLGSYGHKALAISPDGKYLVYSLDEGLNLNQLNTDAPSEPIVGTSNSSSPFFSPDSKWIGFHNTEEDKIMKIPLTGGNPVTICDLKAGMEQANWYEHEIIYADGNAIYRVPDSGGTPELLYQLVRSGSYVKIWNPQLLPDKKTLLFSQSSGNGFWSILTWRLGSKEDPSVLVEQGRDGRYLNSGHIAYTLNNRLYICKFNSRTNRIASEPQIIATNPVNEFVLFNYGASQFDFSDNGILVYYEQQGTDQYRFVWVGEDGTVSPPVSSEARRFEFTATSSDAKYIAVSNFDDKGSRQVEIINAKTGNSQLFAEDSWSPAWSVDNSSVYYVSRPPGNQVFQKPLDLSAPPVMLFEIDSSGSIGLYGISSDGKYLLFDAFSGDGWDIGYYDIMNNKAEMLDYYNHPGKDDHRPMISPDGKWIAYRSDYSGQVAIYVAPFPGPGQPKRVTSSTRTNYIGSPAWAPDMTALYYFTTGPDFELWKINMQFSENDFSSEAAQSFFNGGRGFASGYGLDIHPDGDRFLIGRSEETTEFRIKVIGNWEQELTDK